MMPVGRAVGPFASGKASRAQFLTGGEDAVGQTFDLRVGGVSAPYGKVRRVGRDTGVTPAKNGVSVVLTFTRRTAGARAPFIAVLAIFEITGRMHLATGWTTLAGFGEAPGSGCRSSSIPPEDSY